MNQRQIERLTEAQRQFFNTGATLPVAFRKQALVRLRQTILQYQEEIIEALQADLCKSPYESFMCEIGLVLQELRFMLKHIQKFARDQKVRTSLTNFASASFIRPSPYGTVLVMSPWNYPFLLSVEPLIDAVAAGNTVVLKPSAYAEKTAKIIQKIIQAAFAPEHAAVVLGGRAENTALLETRFDYIFFTGSKSVGKEVMTRAAAHLTPVTLELGGKSPCIVEKSANIALSARRIVFGKFLNCGQTCVAPDYILCDEAIREELIGALQFEINRQFGESALNNPAYGRIVNQKHFDRLLSLIDPEKAVIGGRSDPQSLKIEPTVLSGVDWQDDVMQDEIFGPLLPVLTYRDYDDALLLVSQRAAPLALYIFSENQPRIQQALTRCRFGGGCVNDTVAHLISAEMPFGGVGESGMGAYHGKAGFDTFTHQKSIVNKKTWVDLPLRYQPYQAKYERFLQKILK